FLKAFEVIGYFAFCVVVCFFFILDFYKYLFYICFLNRVLGFFKRDGVCLWPLSGRSPQGVFLKKPPRWGPVAVGVFGFGGGHKPL
ncbi:hypothetical protein ACVGWX_04990, partial [Enterobacter hormaechei]